MSATAARQIPNAAYIGKWSVELCRSCYAWMPDMDLRLAPAPGALERNHTPPGETYWMIERFKAAASGRSAVRVYRGGKFVGIGTESGA